MKNHNRACGNVSGPFTSFLNKESAVPAFVSPRMVVLSVLVLCLSIPASAQNSIDVNIGLSASKSLLGVSYTSGKNQVNVGLRGFAYSGRDGVYLQPGLSYNRYLTQNGFYAWVAYVAEYRSSDSERLAWDPVNGNYVRQVEESKGWYPGFALTGLGKSWQFSHWGLHLDAGVGTPADRQVGRKWGPYLGGAVSYRFHLDD